MSNNLKFEYCEETEVIVGVNTTTGEKVSLLTNEAISAIPLTFTNKEAEDMHREFALDVVEALNNYDNAKECFNELIVLIQALNKQMPVSFINELLTKAKNLHNKAFAAGNR